MAKKAVAEERVAEVNWDFLEEPEKAVKETKRGKPGMTEAMKAMCAQCMGGWLDGKDDCPDCKCPLYSWYPYKEKEPNLDWRTKGLHIAANRRKLKYDLLMAGVKEEKRQKESEKQRAERQRQPQAKKAPKKTRGQSKK